MAARRLVDDLVIFGRFTTFAGETEYYSLPIHVLDYEKIEITAWRGKMPDAADDLEITLQDSLDNTNWSTKWTLEIEETEQSWTDTIRYPWLRVMVQGVVGGSLPIVATGYVVGRLFLRRS